MSMTSKSYNETSGQVTWALKNEPTIPLTAGLIILYYLTSWTSGQAASYNSKWWRTVFMNFGPLWRGISVGLDALKTLKPRSVTQFSVIFLLATSKNTPFLE